MLPAIWQNVISELCPRREEEKVLITIFLTARNLVVWSLSPSKRSNLARSPFLSRSSLSDSVEQGGHTLHINWFTTASQGFNERKKAEILLED